MTETHNFDRRQVFRSLGLGASLIAGNQEEGSIHDGGSVQHGGHENVVSGTIDKTDVTSEAVFHAIFFKGIGMAGTTGSVRGFGTAHGRRHGRHSRCGGSGVGLGGCRIGWSRRFFRSSRRIGTGNALVDFGIGVSQLNGNVTFQFVLETDRLHSTNGFDDGRLSVSDVTNRTNINRGLAGDLNEIDEGRARYL